MTSPVSMQQLIDAGVDCGTIATIATSTSETVVDRLGQTKLTMVGACNKIGFEQPYPYSTSGQTLLRATQTVTNGGLTYAPALNTTYPFVTSGSFNPLLWRVIASTDVQIIRDEAKAIFKNNNSANNVIALRATDPYYDGQIISLLSHTNIANGGGGEFYYDATDTASTDNNGTVIVTSSGKRLKRKDTTSLSLKQFGAIEGQDVAVVFQKVLDATPKTLKIDGVYPTSVKCQVKSDGVLIDFSRGSKLTATTNMDAVIYSEDKQNLTVLGANIDGGGLTVCNIWSRTKNTNIVGFSVLDAVNLIGTKADANLFYGTILADNTVGKASVFRHKKVKFNGNTIGACGTHGALAAYCDGVEFLNNKLDGPQNHGFEAVNCTSVKESFNEVFNCGVSGLGVGDWTDGWEISHNLIKNCAGDGSITIEHNSVNGVCDTNTAIDCNTNGINFSFGTAGAAPYNKLHNVKITNNTLKAKAGVTTYADINAYSSTGGGMGELCDISNNNSTGFGRGLTAAYFKNSNFDNNRSDDLSGSAEYVVKLTLVQRSSLMNPRSNSFTANDPIQLRDYAGLSCDRITVSGGYVSTINPASSLILVEGTGSHNFSGVGTDGALHAVNATGASAYVWGGFWGNISGTKVNGGAPTTW